MRRMSSAPARSMGLADRGRLEPGLRADVNVIDLARVSERMPAYARDFPNGAFVLENDAHTGARGGRALRS